MANDMVGRLERGAALLDRKLLTADEFVALKRNILAETVSAESHSNDAESEQVCRDHRFFNKSALDYWSRVPTQKLRECVNADSSGLALCAALFITVSLGSLYALQPSDFNSENENNGPVFSAHTALMAFSAVTSFGCISISTFTYIQSSKIADKYLIRFICCMKGRPYLEPVLYFWLSVFSLLAGVGCAVYLLAGYTNMVVAASIAFPNMAMLFFLDQILHSACVHYMQLQSAPVSPPSPPLGVVAVRAPVALQYAS
jgi:hypothetical protein